MGLDTSRFPNGGYEVKLVRKKDILKTIDDNIIDKELAEELINNLETKAERYLSVDKDAWIGIPFLGNIRGSRNINKDGNEEFQAARQYIRENKSHDEYVMFMKEASKEWHYNNQYEAYFKLLIAKYARLYPISYRRWYKEKGEHYAKCKIVFSNCHRASRQPWEYLYEIDDNLDND